MDYQEIIRRVKELDFIGDEETADAAVKAVLGILASRLDEVQARRLTESLPEPLTLERLRGHQKRIEEISVAQYIAEIGTQFKISTDQANTLINTVLHIAKEATGDGVLVEIENRLPSDWAETIQKA